MIFIEGNFPSFKNSKQRTKAGFIVMSATVQRYMKKHGAQWKTVPEEFKDLKESDFPVKVGLHFIRGTRHRFDFHNMVQGVSDLMVSNGWIPDDSMDYFIPVCTNVDGKYYGYSKENPGVAIELLK